MRSEVGTVLAGSRGGGSCSSLIGGGGFFVPTHIRGGQWSSSPQRSRRPATLTDRRMIYLPARPSVAPGDQVFFSFPWTVEGGPYNDPRGDPLRGSFSPGPVLCGTGSL